MGEVLRVDNLRKTFRTGDMRIHALNGVSFSVNSGESIALVGESGCGKTTAARCILCLYKPDAGKIYFNSIEISELPEREVRPMRQKLQMVFQDASTSLNPRMNVRQILSEPAKLFRLSKGSETERRVIDTLSLVQLAREHLDRYPHQLSGGQQQRVAIARTIITNPDCLVLDEPTASQDSSVKVQLMALLRDLQREMNMACIFISHDLSVVKSLCTRILVMYLGKLVEVGDTVDVFSRPKHPYTTALLSAIPIPDPRAERRKIKLRGEALHSADFYEGCGLFKRCPVAQPICGTQEPPLKDTGNEHCVACHFV